jgi:large repetitive protein
VVDVNRPPVLEPIVDQTVDEGATLDVAVSASDPDGDALTLSLLDPPGFAALTDNGDGTGSITFEPGFGDVGVYEITVEVSDGELTATTSFTLTVVDVNRPPTIEPIVDQTVDEGGTLDVAVSASDPDGDVLVLSAEPDGFGIGELIDNGDGTGSITLEPGFGDVGVYEITSWCRTACWRRARASRSRSRWWTSTGRRHPDGDALTCWSRSGTIDQTVRGGFRW